MNGVVKISSWVGLSLASAAVAAAPLDTQLTVHDESPGEGYVEAGIDRMNDTLDVFDIRGESDNFSGSTIGDYDGHHLRGGIRIAPRLWIDGAYWERDLTYGDDSADISSWQLAGQVRLLDHQGLRPGVSLRLGYWGNQLDALHYNGTMSVAGYEIEDVKVPDLEDRQRQLDLIATWRPSSSWRYSLFAGVGRGEVDAGSPTATVNGRPSTISSPSTNRLIVEAQDPGMTGCGGADWCAGGPRGSPVSLSSSANGGPYPGPGMGINYDADYYQLGGNVAFSRSGWRALLGYAYLETSRDIEELVARNGDTSYQVNQVLTTEVGRQVADHVGLLLRAQIYERQLLGEVPLTYNAYTTDWFDEVYGIVTLGVRFDF